VIGGLANKNFAAVLEALPFLPERVRARAIGAASEELRALAQARAPGRVIFDGVVPEAALPDFLRAVDVVAHVETAAGWANIVAEALASGAPVVSLDAPTPAAIAAGVERLLAEPDLAPRLAAAGRAHVLRFGWARYARAMLNLCLGPGEAEEEP
jgi:glycosyltransferase involved in cell wall biosynthesis